MNKICAKCQLSKPIDDFSKKGNSRRHNLCKQCRRSDYAENKDRHKQTYLNNRDKRLTEQRRQRLRRKTAVFNHYGNKCECCGEDKIEFLTIDHKDGDGSKHRRSLGKPRKTDGRANPGGGAIYLWIINNGFPDNLRILCWNCNSSIGLFGYCPHQKPILIS